MSTRIPTGRLVDAGVGHDLVITRSMPWPPRDVWAGIAEPERTARWFGRWVGDAVVGATIRVQLDAEDGTPWTDLRIVECDQPRLLRVLFGADDSDNDSDNDDDVNGSSWDISVELTASGATTELRFVMHAIDPATVGEIGPGWEYYLDRLVASLAREPLPDFDDYLPAQREYFEAQAH